MAPARWKAKRVVIKYTKALPDNLSLTSLGNTATVLISLRISKISVFLTTFYVETWDL